MIRKNAAPLGEFRIGRRDQTLAFITVEDDMGKQLRIFPGYGAYPLFSQEQKIDPLKIANGLSDVADRCAFPLRAKLARSGKANLSI